MKLIKWLTGPVLKNFQEFALKGNVIDLAVGIVVGAAFTNLINLFVKDILMPPIGLLLKGIDFSNNFVVLASGKVWKAPYNSLADATQAGAVTINIGSFINTIIQFFITAFAVYLIVRGFNRLRSVSLEKALEGKLEILPAEPTTRECQFCTSTISVRAVRCPHCTSEVSTGVNSLG